MTDYSKIIRSNCSPQVTTELRTSIVQEFARLRMIHSENIETFSIVAGNRTGAFIGKFLDKNIDVMLLTTTPTIFDSFLEEYAIYFNAVQHRTIETLYEDKPHIDELFDLLRGDFGSKLLLLVNSCKLYLERVTAWEKYWKFAPTK